MSAVKWRLTAHALRRITERFSIEKNSAANWVNQHMADAKYVCNTLAEDGTYGRLFTKSGILFFADLVESAIITVYKAEILPPAVSVISSILEREVRRKEIEVLKAEKEALEKRLPLEQEAVNLRLTIARTKTESRRLALTARMNAVENEIRSINANIAKIKRELTHLAQGFASII